MYFPGKKKEKKKNAASFLNGDDFLSRPVYHERDSFNCAFLFLITRQYLAASSSGLLGHQMLIQRFAIFADLF
jgi:hypothetical protein